MKNPRYLVVTLLAAITGLASTAHAAAGDLEMPSGLSTHFTTMGTAIVAAVGVVALAAFSLKIVPMGLRFMGKVWRAVAGG